MCEVYTKNNSNNDNDNNKETTTSTTTTSTTTYNNKKRTTTMNTTRRQQQQQQQQQTRPLTILNVSGQAIRKKMHIFEALGQIRANRVFSPIRIEIRVIRVQSSLLSHFLEGRFAKTGFFRSENRFPRIGPLSVTQQQQQQENNNKNNKINKQAAKVSPSVAALELPK